MLGEANIQLIVPILNVLVGANFSLILISSELHTSFPSLSWDFPVFSYDKTSQHSKGMDNLNVDWSSGWILSCTLSLHAEGPWFKSWQGGAYGVGVLARFTFGGPFWFWIRARLHIWGCIWIWSRGEVSFLTLIGLFEFLTCKPRMLASCQE